MPDRPLEPPGPDRPASSAGDAHPELRGVWAAIPIPWRSEGEIDADLVRLMVQRYRDAGLNGCYTTGTDGELHALDLGLFTQLAECFRDATVRADIPSQLGVSWLNMAGVLERARLAERLGYSIVQTALPFWETLSSAETADFLRALADAVPSRGIVHYNIAKVGRLIGGKEYAALKAATPTLIGTKLTGGDIDLTIDCLEGAPTLRHFVVDGHMMPAALFGAAGIYSAIANLNPRWTAAWWAAVDAGDWPEVARRRVLLFRFRARWRTILDGITASPAFAHVFARCGILPEISLRIQAPYRTATEEQADELRRVIATDFPELQYVP